MSLMARSHGTSIALSMWSGGNDWNWISQVWRIGRLFLSGSREVDLASKPGLIIVYGPNEAGKSTLLNAIRDLLYGVPHTSPHGAVFGNDKIRISATLRLSNAVSFMSR